MARIRSVYPRAQVAHLYANASQDHARNAGGNFYFHGIGAYSYRDSYAVAIRSPWTDSAGNALVFMRRKDYGPTTARHAADVRSAFRGHPVRIIETEPPNGWRDDAERFDLNRATADAIARGDASACAAFRSAVVAECIRYACAEALKAETRNSAERCAADYQRAEEAIDDARAVADAAADKAERRALVARIDREAPPSPTLGACPEYGRGVYGDAWAEYCRAVEAWAAPALPWARAARKARKAAGLGAAAAKALAGARSAERDALAKDKDPASAAGLVAAWTRAASAWTTAAKAADKAGDKPGAKACKARAAKAGAKAEKAKPAAAMASARSVVRYMTEAARFIVGKAAAARHFRRHKGAARWVRGVTAEAKRACYAWPDSADKAHGKGQALEAFAAMLAARLEGREAVTYARHGGAECDAVAALIPIAAGRGALAKRAADTLATVRATLAGGLVTDARARFRALERTRAIHIAASEYQRVAGLIVPGAVTLENARAYASAIRNAETAIADGARIAPRVWDSRLESVRRAYSVARELAMIAETASTAVRAIADARNVDRFAKDAREALEAGRAFAARDALARVDYCADAARHIRATADRLASVADMPGTLPAVAEAARAESARLAAFADAAARDSAVPDAIRERIAAAVAYASADAARHWRASGERMAGWNAVAFRRRADGDIESTLGAIVSESAGRRLWALIRACVAAGKGRDWGHNGGPRVGPFHLSRIGADGSAVVGCHSIAASEARAFAEYMGWPPFGPVTDADTLEGGAA